MPFYAVRYRDGSGKVFTRWNQCRSAVNGVSGVSHMKFDDRDDAYRFINGDERPYYDEYEREEMEDEFISRFSYDDLIEQQQAGEVAVYCDGCYFQDGRTGYGIWINHGDERNRGRPVNVRERNSYVAEVFALRAALKLIERDVVDHMRGKVSYIPKYVVYTDSETVVNLINQYIWTQNRYFAGPAGQELRESFALFTKIRDFYRERPAVFADHEFEVRWIRGHAGLYGNEMADDLAREGAIQSRPDYY